MKTITHKQLHERLLTQPGFNEAYSELELEFKLIREIIRARAKEGLTQEALAKRMGTTQSAIARFESGRANPTLDFLRRLALALGLDLRITVR